MNKEEILIKIQEEELKLLKEFIKICSSNKIKYFSLGGSLLGAVRHKGFIPWDDDMDLGLPRKDFEKLTKEIDFDKYNKNYILENSEVNLGVYQYKLKSGVQISGKVYEVCLDIFPLDGVPNNNLKKYYFEKKILLYRMLYKFSVIDQVVEKDRGILENLLVKTAKLLKLNRIISTSIIHQKLTELIKSYDYDSSKNVGNILGRYREKEIVDKEYFGKGILLPFEDTYINCPINYDSYLKCIYGNYMQLPPMENRISHFEELEK